MTQRLRILVSAYACEPGRGSEPGVGWNWACNLARDHDVWVITRKNNKGVIDAALEREPRPNLHFAYFDLPKWARFWKSWPLCDQLYYYLWQAGVYFTARRLTREVKFDFVQHCTFVKYWAPSFLSLLGVPFLWGPVGGGESTPRAFRSVFSLRGKIYDFARNTARAIGSADPFVKATARRARIGFAATEDTAARLRALGCGEVHVFPAVALNDEDLEALAHIPPHREGPFRIASLGNLLHLKGFNMAIDAFARFIARGGTGEYWIIGDGPERQRLEALTRRLGVSELVRFWGRLPRAEAIDRLGECDLLAHPTLHDSGGWACLEAMAASRPVVCLDLGGPGLVVTPQTGIKIAAVSPEQAIAGLASAFEQLAGDRELRAKLGEAARARVWSEYRWEDKPGRFLRLCGVETRDEVLQ